MTVLALVACKKDGEGPDKQLPSELQPTQAVVDTGKLKAPALFAHIPADTPYVLASFEAVSLDYYAKLKDGLGGVFSKLVKKKQRAPSMDFDPDGNPIPAASDDKLFDVLVEELAGKLDAKGFESLGLSATPRFAIYGLGLAPVVFRIEIKDEKVLLATIERVATKAGKTLPPQETKDGKSFWRQVEDDATLVIGIFDGHLVAAAGPTQAVDAKLGLILGTEKPQASMADGKALADVMTKHGFGPNLIGYVDTRKVASQAVAFADMQLPQVCIAELDRIATKVPRMVLGYTEISAKRASGGIVLELEPSLLAEVAALKTEVPGLGAAMSDKPLLAFGGGIDLAKGQALLMKTVGSVGKLGDLCQSSELAREAGQLVEKLNQPLPDAVKQITGAVVALHTFKMSKRGIPDALDGFALLTSSDARALYDLAKGMAPPLASLGISTDGKLSKLAIPGGAIPFDVHASVGAKAIVLAAGAKGRALGERGLNGSASGKAPFLVMTYDYARFAEIQAELTKLNSYDDSLDQDMADLQKSVGAMFDRGNFSVDVNDKGLVLWGALDMK